MLRNFVLARILLSLVLCCLVACSGNTRAPVEDRVIESLDSVYSVKKGDTLYSIAFRYGLDFRKVATANGITAPYVIYPGQKINLGEAVPPREAVSRAMPAQGSEPDYKAPSSSGAVFSPVPVPVPVPVSVPAASKLPMEKQGKPAVDKAATVAAPAASKRKSKTYVGSKVTTWLWPAAGPVTRGYAQNVHKGIDIGGNRGDPIVAVAAGKVVYAGTGIVGFGELLIVKHNDVYLSAYGHNDVLLVTEGQTVSAGEVIAQKGSSGTDTVKLHFEVRKEGKPIDPQKVLPRR